MMALPSTTEELSRRMQERYYVHHFIKETFKQDFKLIQSDLEKQLLHLLGQEILVKNFSKLEFSVTTPWHTEVKSEKILKALTGDESYGDLKMQFEEMERIVEIIKGLCLSEVRPLLRFTSEKGNSTRLEVTTNKKMKLSSRTSTEEARSQLRLLKENIKTPELKKKLKEIELKTIFQLEHEEKIKIKELAEVFVEQLEKELIPLGNLLEGKVKDILEQGNRRIEKIIFEDKLECVEEFFKEVY